MSHMCNARILHLETNHLHDTNRHRSGVLAHNKKGREYTAFQRFLQNVLFLTSKTVLSCKQVRHLQNPILTTSNAQSVDDKPFRTAQVLGVLCQQNLSTI